MTLDDNSGAGPNYFPNSFDGPTENKTQGGPAQQSDGFAARYDHNEGSGNDDHYTQPGNLFRLSKPEARKDLITNIGAAMSGIEGTRRDLITQRQPCHWFRADIRWGIAKGFGIEAKMPTRYLPEPSLAVSVENLKNMKKPFRLLETAFCRPLPQWSWPRDARTHERFYSSFGVSRR